MKTVEYYHAIACSDRWYLGSPEWVREKTEEHYKAFCIKYDLEDGKQARQLWEHHIGWQERESCEISDLICGLVECYTYWAVIMMYDHWRLFEPAFEDALMRAWKGEANNA